MKWINISLLFFNIFCFDDLIFLRLLSITFFLMLQERKELGVGGKKLRQQHFLFTVVFFIFDEKRKIIAPLGHHSTKTNRYNNTTFFSLSFSFSFSLHFAAVTE